MVDKAADLQNRASLSPLREVSMPYITTHVTFIRGGSAKLHSWISGFSV
jgi:hypothetical protein